MHLQKAAANQPDQRFEGGGANFVDTSIQIVVKQAKGTLMVFRPKFYHGTTLAAGAVNHAVTYAFSKRVCDGWRDLQKKKGVKVLNGAGEGSPYFEPKVLKPKAKGKKKN